jgi:lincosamide nucleotidyltransferase A/C/D/E
MMTADMVLEVIDTLTENGINVWIDGGWNVDALLGEQTREHDDLDIAVRLQDQFAFEVVMTDVGFRITEMPFDFQYVMRDDQGFVVDVHFVDLTRTKRDDNGIEVYEGIAYHVGSLEGTGVIAGQTVACCTAEAQVAFHCRYEPTAKDVQDVLALCERFDIPVPEPYSSMN